MHFGLTNVPVTFRGWTNHVLRGLIPSTCLVNTGDVLVHGRITEQQLTNSEVVLGRIDEAWLNCNEFFRSEVNVLDHIGSREGNKILSWPSPSCKAELRSFLRLATHRRRFVKHFAASGRSQNNLLGNTAEESPEGE